MLASFLRLGFIANFISEPVLIGFKAGIGLVIVVDQIPKLLGIHFPKGPSSTICSPSLKASPRRRWRRCAVGAVMIAILVGIERFRPRAPAPLIAVAAGIAGMGLLGLQALRSGIRRPDSPGIALLFLAGLLPRCSSSGPAPWASR